MTQAGTTLTSFGARTITVRMPSGTAARTFSLARASSRRASSVMSAGHLEPVAHLAPDLHHAGDGVLDEQSRVGHREVGV